MQIMQMSMIWFLTFFEKKFTVTKAKRDAGPQHMGDGKFRHPRRTIRKIRHQHRSGRCVYGDEGIFRHPRVVGLRNSVGEQ
jgi:hypothetical protein